MGSYWILIALCASSFCFIEAQRPTVKFSNTIVQGVVQKTRKGRDVESFWSIPYAELPIGNLRFSDPTPKVYPEGTTLQGDQPPKRCLQSVARDRARLISLRDSKGVEDCLYLNVHRPASAESQSLPVMVYFQGADMIPGTDDNPRIGPDYLLDENPIILVTLTYRLGVFGFLTTGDEAAPGNFGLKDQKLALQWVQSNIAAFGGDSNRVTIFGQSEAAKLIHIQALVPHTAGLFHQYILQSGCALAPWAVRDSKTGAGWTADLATLNGCATNSSSAIIDCLRQMDPRELLELSFEPFSKLDITLFKMWPPTKEPMSPGAYLTDCPDDLIARGGQRDLPFMAGLTINEKLYTTSADPRKDDFWDLATAEVFGLYNTTLGSLDSAGVVNNFYDKEAQKKVANEASAINEAIRFFLNSESFVSDTNYYSPQVKMLEERKNNSGKPFYFYSFGYRGEFSLYDWRIRRHGKNRATHGDLLLYLFLHDFSKFPGWGGLSMNEKDYRVVDSIVQMWSSFATNGVPRTAFGEVWKPYGSQKLYLEIGKDKDYYTEMALDFQSSRMNFWADFNLQHCN